MSTGRKTPTLYHRVEGASWGRPALLCRHYRIITDTQNLDINERTLQNQLQHAPLWPSHARVYGIGGTIQLTPDGFAQQLIEAWPHFSKNASRPGLDHHARLHFLHLGEILQTIPGHIPCLPYAHRHWLRRKRIMQDHVALSRAVRLLCPPKGFLPAATLCEIKQILGIQTWMRSMQSTMPGLISLSC